MGKSRKINSDRFITIPHPIIRLNIKVILPKYPESTLVFPWKLRVDIIQYIYYLNIVMNYSS